MQLSDVENLSAAELKARRDELIQATCDVLDNEEGVAAGVHELARRYVQARLDAKLRDEKLAEQGTTIISLNKAVELLQRKVSLLESGLDKECRAIKARETELTDLKLRLADEINGRTDEKLRADRLKAEATAFAQAFHEAEAALDKARSQLQIETADRG